ncbi:MAG TPA: integrase core domain-containing protein [Micromonospora sp.]|nr:integrase core domain-containing protein [Micromonospora sp.]
MNLQPRPGRSCQPVSRPARLRATYTRTQGVRHMIAALRYFALNGTDHTAADYAKACNKLGIQQSMGRVGCALDNAAAEAFNSTIKVEYIHRHRFHTRTEARIKTATWIVDFYNLRRRHSACDGMSPIDYERFTAQARGTEAA